MRDRAGGPRYGLARVLSKRGLCSRSEAERRVREGRVRVGGRVIRDPEFAVTLDAPHIEVDGDAALAATHHYIALNKPRGLVTTARDEQGRDTVYRCFDGASLGWIAPVGRLDRASEGLLLFSSDSAWAARVTDPGTGPQKTYHVQVDGLPDGAMLESIERGVDDAGEHLQAASARLLRQGARNAWLEIVLDEGRNRQIRRLLAAHELSVLRLVRVAIGGVPLGDLGKGAWRPLLPEEITALARPSGPASG